MTKDKLVNKIRVHKNEDDPRVSTINVFLIAVCCLITIASVYFFVINPSIKIILVASSLLILNFLSFGFVDSFFNDEFIEMRIENNQLVLKKLSKEEKFDIHKCKLEYYFEKSEWLTLKCEDKDISTWILAERPKDNFFKFINTVNMEGK